MQLADTGTEDSEAKQAAEEAGEKAAQEQAAGGSTKTSVVPVTPAVAAPAIVPEGRQKHSGLHSIAVYACNELFCSQSMPVRSHFTNLAAGKNSLSCGSHALVDSIYASCLVILRARHLLDLHAAVGAAKAKAAKVEAPSEDDHDEALAELEKVTDGKAKLEGVARLAEQAQPKGSTLDSAGVHTPVSTIPPIATLLPETRDMLTAVNVVLRVIDGRHDGASAECGTAVTCCITMCLLSQHLPLGRSDC